MVEQFAELKELKNIDKTTMHLAGDELSLKILELVVDCFLKCSAPTRTST